MNKMKISIEDEGKVIFQTGAEKDITPNTQKEVDTLIENLKHSISILKGIEIETGKEEVFTVKIGNGTDSVNVGRAVLSSILLEGHKVDIEK